MDIDRRYSMLRNRLDSIYRTEHLDVGSVELVEKLLKDYTKISEQLRNLKKQSNQNAAKPELKDVEHRFDLLMKQYQEVLSENEKIKGMLSQKSQQSQDEANDRIRLIRERYDAKITELTEKLRAKQDSEPDYKNQVQSLLSQNHMLGQQIKKTEMSYMEAMQQVGLLKQQLNQTANFKEELDKNKKSDLENMIARKNQQIQEYEQNEQVLKAKMNALTREVEAAENDKRKAQMEARNSLTLIQTLKVQNKEQEKSINMLKAELQQSQNAMETLKRTKMALESQLYRQHEQQLQAESTTEAGRQAKQRLEQIHEETTNQLQMKRQQNSQLQDHIDNLTKQTHLLQQKIKELNSKNNMLNRSLNEMQSQLELLTSKMSMKMRENRELETSKGLLEKQLRDMEPIKKQNQKLEEELRRIQTEKDITKDSHHRKNLEVQSQIYQEQIEILKQNEQALVIKNQKLQSELRRLETVINNGGKQIELINSQKQSLVKENKELLDTLSTFKNSDHSNKTMVLKFQQKINSNQLLIQDLKSTLQAESARYKTLVQEMHIRDTTIKQNEQKIRNLHHDNVRLRQLCESVESTKCELYEKLKMSSTHRTQSEEQRLRYTQQYQQLKERLHRAEQELRRKQTAMIAIDDERDQMQHILDEKTEENNKLQERIEQLENMLRSQTKQHDRSEMSHHALQNRIISLENQNEGMRKQNERLSMDLQSKTAYVGKLEVQLQSKSNEMELLVLSSKEQQREKERMQAAFNENQRRLSERTIENTNLREQCKVYLMDSEQITKNYQQQLAERRRLEGYVRELEEANHEMYDILNQRDIELAQYKQHIMLQEQKENMYMTEIANYERQLGYMTNELNNKEDDVRRLCAQRDTLRLEHSRRSQPTELKQVFEERVSFVQNELQIKKMECQRLRQQLRELEKVIEVERNNNFMMARQLNDKQTPIKNLLGHSILDSGVQNSSLHANSYERPEMRLQESFQSHTSICSKKLQQRMQMIEQQYANTHFKYRS